MPTLELSFRDKTIGNYALQKGVPMTIGRRNDNDIVIDNLAVSSHHAKIDSVGDGFVLVDLQSKNGLFVNEKQVGSHWLQKGDVISIGKHALAFGYADGEEEPDTQPDEIERTMAMDTSHYRAMLNKNKAKAQTKPEDREEPETVRLDLKKADTKATKKAPKKDIVGILKYQAGGRGKHICRKSITKIGKHPSCDIIVKGFMVGNTSATISRESDGFYLSYSGGWSRPKVNGQKIKLETILRDRDLIDIGSSRLQFFERKAIKSKKKRPTKNKTRPESSPA